MSWSPQTAVLEQILLLLRQSRSPVASNDYHKQVQMQLNSFNAQPEFNNYLMFILSSLKEEDEGVRATAGLLLKNNIRTMYSTFPIVTQEYIKHNSLVCIGDPLPLVRNTAGTVITTICTHGIRNWSSLLLTLYQFLSNPDQSVVEGAFDAFSKICEDCAQEMDSEELGRPLNTLIPKFIQFFDSPVDKIRFHAIHCINQFIHLKPNALLVNLNAFIQGLYNHATDSSPYVRRCVCQGLVMLLEVRPDDLMPQIHTIVKYMLHSTKDQDETIAQEACEFWLAFAEQTNAYEMLHPVLPDLIPLLVSRMVYNENDPALIRDKDDDYYVPDSQQDIKPQFHKAKRHVLSDMPTQTKESEDSDSEGEEEEEEEEGEDIYSEWTLRKCSAAALDIMATVFQNEILPYLLPVLKQYLSSERWELRECGILALGAVAEGCSGGMEQHLPELVPFLFSSLKDTKPLIRTITCWTLSRYSSWMIHHSAKNVYFEPLISLLLQRIMDNNKRVQEAACSAFATIEEEAGVALVPYLEHIIKTFISAFQKYQHKNLLILYDAIGTLAEAVGGHFNNPNYLHPLMIPLMEKWNQLADDERDLFPLLECLGSLATVSENAFVPYAKVIYDRCVRILANSLHAFQMSLQDPSFESPDSDFIIIALDVISGLTEGLKVSVESLITSSSPPLLPMLYECLRSPFPEVRQSGFALLGDLAISCFPLLKPALQSFFNEILGNLVSENPSVSNNSAWSLGEIAIQFGKEMEPFVLPFLEPLVKTINQEKSHPRTLLENIAITIGRLGLACPAKVAPHLATFAQPWCKAIRSVRDNHEKESAFRGMCALIELNPNGIARDFAFFCDAVASWHQPPQDLGEQFSKILNGFKRSVSNDWNVYYASFPEPLRRKMTEKYGL